MTGTYASKFNNNKKQNKQKKKQKISGFYKPVIVKM